MSDKENIILQYISFAGFNFKPFFFQLVVDNQVKNEI